MFRSAVSGGVLAFVLAGCSGLAHKDPDPTPVNPTAVLEIHMINEGIRGFPNFESTTLSYTRANMQRKESTIAGAGTIARLLGGASADARIDRLDRKLVWILDAKNKQFTECPYMDPSSVASTPFFGLEVRLLTYIRSLTTASFWEAGP